MPGEPGPSDPTEDEVNEFVKVNGVDDRAAADLKESTPAVQRAVLNRGDLSTARNPSAALLVRIRDAKLGDRGERATSGSSMGLPSSAEVENFISRNALDDSAASSLRSSSPTMKRNVIAAGDLGGPNNVPALQARMSAARSGGGAVVPVGMGLPSPADVEDFIKMNEVDDRSAENLRTSAPQVQRIVISRGDLRSARNPSSALLARIRDAKAAPPEAPAMPPMAGYPPAPGYPGYYPPPGYAPPGYPPPPGYPGYPPYGYPGYPGYGGYPGYPPPPGYPGAPPLGAPGAPPPGPGAPAAAAPGASRKKGRGRSQSYSSYSGSSYSGSPSRSPSPKERSRGGKRKPRGRSRSPRGKRK